MLDKMLSPYSLRWFVVEGDPRVHVILSDEHEDRARFNLTLRELDNMRDAIKVHNAGQVA
jgi:hypothetical protein